MSNNFAVISTPDAVGESASIEPRMFNVVFHNDDETTTDFVVGVLRLIYDHPREAAVKLMLTVHNEGSSIVGTYPFEIAEAKVEETIDLARTSGFPLYCNTQPEPNHEV